MGSPKKRLQYTYDSRGNRRSLMDQDGGRFTYSYDAVNRITQVQNPQGNRTTYSWDSENRLTLARLPAGTRSTMAYEPEGLRVKLEESTGTKKLVWDDQNYLAETDAAHDTQVVYTNAPAYYGRLISQRRGSTTSWFHFDAIGSTRELSAFGAVQTDTFAYSSFGYEVIHSGISAPAFRFGGQVGYHSHSLQSTLYIRFRHYNIHEGRWLSQDPIWPTVPGHRYLYSDNNPASHVDPSGLSRFLGLPATPSKCAEAEGLMTAYASSMRGTTYDWILWKHYLGRSGQQLSIGIDAFDPFGSNRTQLLNHIYDTLPRLGIKASTIGRNKRTYLGSAKAERSFVNDKTLMISGYWMSSSAHFWNRTSCWYCWCNCYIDSSASFVATDITDFDPGKTFGLELRGVGYEIADALILACNSGTPFDISGGASENGTWLIPCNTIV